MLVQIRKRCSFEYVKIKPAILCSPLEIGPYLWLELKWIDVDTGRNYWLMPFSIASAIARRELVAFSLK